MIVSYRHWQQQNFDRDLLTRSIRINGQDYAIVGVAPEGFGGTTAILGIEFWLPLGVHYELGRARERLSHREQEPGSHRSAQSFDVASLATTASLLGFASLAAAFIPAWRAAGISPSTAIRATD